MPNPLNHYSILIADADPLLANTLKMMLGEMGFPRTEVTHSGVQAHKLIRKKPFDFLITEWNIRELDGIELIRQIRYGPPSSNPMLPIVMLTGRAEQSDVAMARDSGINEFVVKPFSARTIYNRIERLIEKPRHFIATPTFIGPDRRHKETSAPDGERRSAAVRPVAQMPKERKGTLAGSRPKVWTPDFTLKQKLGPAQRLHMLITTDMLEKAQSSIDAITADSLAWIKKDLAGLKALHRKMLSGNINTYLIVELGETALIISSRAGTFGYTRTADVAYKLYLFYRTRIQPDNATHQVIIQKHIEALQVMLSNNMLGAGGRDGAQIAMELNNLMLKYAP